MAVAVMAVVAFTSCSDDNDDKVISANELPQAAQTFISTYFPTDKVTKVEKDTEHSLATYDVHFASGYEVEFDVEGNWVDVDAPRNKVIPEGIAPVAIAEYVTANYPQSGINEISRHLTGYETELINGEDLHFDLQGNFLYADRD